MGKKIRITESQLKTIVESEKLANTMLGSGNKMSEDEKLLRGAYTILKFGIQEEDFEILTQAANELEQYISQAYPTETKKPIPGSEEPTDAEDAMDDMPGFEGTMDALNSLSIRKNNDDMMNESKQLIKNNFKRFL
jgi:hypothetical protein